MSDEQVPATRSSRWKVLMWMAALVLPIGVFIFSQLDIVQNAQGWFVEGLFWDIGKRDIVADIVAPLWVVSIMVAAEMNRRLISHYAESVGEGGADARESKTIRRVRLSTWIATAGAVAILFMSWTREWARFSEQPDAFWYVSTIVFTLGLLVVPIWWARHPIFADIHAFASDSAVAGAVDGYLFGDHEKGQRWLVVVPFMTIVGVVLWTALGQLDALLQGMHPSGGASVGIRSLASVAEFDLSQKPDHVVGLVSEWVRYSADIGPGFASAIGVSSLYLVLDSFLFVPAYFVVVAVLLLHARRTQPDGLSSEAASSYQLVIGVAFMMLTVLVAGQLFENLMTWLSIRGAWSSPGDLGASTVRLMWFGALFRMIGLFGLVSGGLLILAFRTQRFRSIGSALVAVRGQILVLAFVVLALTLAQTEDVIRRWTVSVAFLTGAMATALAVFIHWSSTAALARLRNQSKAVEQGHLPTPAKVNLPWRSMPVPLRSVVVRVIFAVAAFQVLLVGAFGIPTGLGFVVPAGIVVIMWLFGLALPEATFERGRRQIERHIARWIPRMLGSLVYIVLGLVVVRSAVGQLVYARHGDLWLIFCITPLVVGFYRIHTRSWGRMGLIELVVMGCVSAFGVTWWISNGNPELTPVALTFLGLLIVFGSMPFYYSYDPESLPSRMFEARAGVARVRPLLKATGVIAVTAGAAMVIWPLDVPERFGTVAVVLLGAILFAGFAWAAVAFAERTKPPKILAAFRLRRTPVFIIMLVWLALAGLAATGPSNEVSVIEAKAPSIREVTVDDVWARWSDANLGEDEATAIPMVFVASSGGGIRAAAWTAYVLDCVFEGTVPALGCQNSTADPRSIALMSGVSGGSLGIAAWSSSLADSLPSESSGDWVESGFGRDYLASAMAWLLLIDTPRSFVGLDPSIRDRAEILERSWEKSWVASDESSFLARGVFDIWSNEPAVPLLVFNGTSVNNPCRFNISVLSATAHDVADTCTSLAQFEGQRSRVDRAATLAATEDLVDYLCDDQDLRLSTAVMLSARFPIITPSGRVGTDDEGCLGHAYRSYVVDGGYLDGSGAGTVMELWSGFEATVSAFNTTNDACVVPFLIQIDNGYENPGSSFAGSKPIEVLVPIQTLISSQFGRIASEREQAAIRFDRPLRAGDTTLQISTSAGVLLDSRYARLTTRAHPGIQAPLGWTLSNASFNDLRLQLNTAENQMELAEIDSWLSGGLTCSKLGD